MALGTAAMLGIGALAGGVAGAAGSKSNQSYISQVDAGKATDAEQTGQGMLLGSASQFQNMVNAGPGQSDVAAGLDANRGLAELLKQFSQQGGSQPNAQDISGANDLATKLFGAQRTALGQNFQDQFTQANRQAALMGRDMNDPILRAKLAQEQTRQAGMLDANQGNWATQYALEQPMQRLNFAGQRANVLGGLATQAMANRQALAAMGESIMNNERQFRLNTATRYGNQSTESGGGVGGAISGALGGIGSMAKITGGFGGFGGGGGADPTAGFSGAGGSSFFNQVNPYSSAGGGLQMPGSSPTFGGGGFQFGANSGFGQPKTFSLGG